MEVIRILFSELEQEVILGGNLVFCLLGCMFTLGAKVPSDSLKLKFWFMLFWSGLSFYYAARISVTSMSAGSMNTWEWIGLVILADLPVMAVITGTFLHVFHFSHHPRKIIMIVSTLFYLSWVFAISLDHNAISALLTFISFIIIAWSCRNKSINSSIILMYYACLNFPIRLFGEVPASFGHTVFVLLLITKPLLIGVTYSLLGAKDKEFNFRDSRELV